MAGRSAPAAPVDVRRRALRIGVLHPDLTLGGAERLMVDAARTLQDAGHRVTLFTTRHDRSLCFAETADGTLDVRAVAPPWPPHIGQRLRAPSAIFRLGYLAARALPRSGPFDILFCDVVPHIIPLLKRLSPAKVVFYCHFPDRLLTRQGGALYRLYRRPIDRLESTGICGADAVLVNSRFTAASVKRVFPELSGRSVQVVYPGVDVARYDLPLSETPDQGGEIVLVSLNRFKPEKNHALAIRAVSLVRELVPARVFAAMRLVIAGGFDGSLIEDRRTLQQLRELTQELHLASQVTFLPSCPESERLRLLACCRCLVYTPAGEHFGFGPIEAMAAGRAVVAVAGGGPLETVRHQETGLLCPPAPNAFAAALARLILNPADAARMGLAGRRHVEESFSLAAFGARLSAVLETLFVRAAADGPPA